MLQQRKKVLCFEQKNWEDVGVGELGSCLVGELLEMLELFSWGVV